MEHTGRGKWYPELPYVFPGEVRTAEMPVTGCPGRVETRTAMRVHFVHGHVLYTVVILEEVKFPHPGCARCNMIFPWRLLNGWHPGTAQCNRGAERKIRRLVEAEMWESTERAFEVYGAPIKNVTEFMYLGRVLTEKYDNCPAVVGNLGKVRRSWGRLSGILVREGADPTASRAFYTAVTQAVLLFGSETWVLMPRMEKALDSFQSRVARRSRGDNCGKERTGAGNTHRWLGY